jgi:hypothetical protein
MSVTEQSIPFTQQTMNVAGNGNTTIAAGGDVNLGDTIVQEAREVFFRHDPDSIHVEDAPEAAGKLAELLGRQTLLVLGGAYEDKATIARQVARLLAESVGGADSGAERPRELLEWNRTADFDGLLLALKAETPAMVLLTDLLPQHVAYNLRRLKGAAVSARHHVVATTEVPRAAWKLDPDEELCWKELAADELFDPAKLVSELVREVVAARASLPDGVLREEDEPELTSLGGVTLYELAARLRTPANVAVFVPQLVAAAASADGSLDADAVRDLADAASSESRRVEKWFHTVLRPEEQLLALGLAFFDRLPDDQFFAALERWVGHIRASRDPWLRAYDYSDLDNLQTFFRLVGGDVAGSRVESRWPDLRRVVFQAAWRSHRRQLLAALPVITELVVESADAGRSDWELYGSADRRYQLQRSVGDALSDVGLISVASAETALVRLASEGSAEVQAVAARAVARWREHGGDEQLFALLERWQNDRRIRALVDGFLAGRPADRKRGIQAHLNATIAIAVGFAARYDPPGHLAPKLVALVERLGADRNRLVRSRFTKFTLPAVVASHLAQLRPALREMARHADLAQALGASLAGAYAIDPDEVVRTLQAWHAECDSTRPQELDPRLVTPRDGLLMVLAATYGALAYDDGGPISAGAGFGRLRDILARERHPKVRGAVLTAIARQAFDRFQHVEPMLQQLVPHLPLQERGKVVNVLVEVYRRQRAALEGGDDEVEIGGRRYAVWLSSGRPLTSVETAMIRWARSPAIPASQAIGLQASVAFAQAIDQPEIDEIARLRAERREQAEVDDAARIVNAPVHVAAMQPGWYTGTFVPWLATLSVPEHRAAVSGLLPEALAQNAASPGSLGFLLDRWERLRGEKAAKALAGALRSAMSWHGTAWLALAFGWLLAVALLLSLLLR